MRKSFALAVAGGLTVLLCAQDKMNIWNNNFPETYNTDEVGTMTFSDGVMSMAGVGKSIDIANIDSLTFDLEEGVSQDTIFVTFSDNGVEVNDYSWDKISYETNGGSVKFTSNQNEKNIVYYLRGESSNGQFQLTPDRAVILVMDNLKLSNTNAPIVINSGVDDSYSTYVELIGRSEIADGQDNNYKGAIYAKSKLRFGQIGSDGTLTVTGNAKHAINSSKKTEVYNGTIIIDGAVSDGLNSDGLQMYGGSMTFRNFGSDAVDASEVIEINGGNIFVTCSNDDTKGLKSDSILVINDGTVDISLSGAASKAIKSSKSPVVINGGEVKLSADGTALYNSTDNDYSYSSCIKSDLGVEIAGGTLILGSAGEGSKAISADGDVRIENGKTTITITGKQNIANGDTTYCTAIKTDGSFYSVGGEIEITLGDAGIAHKGINADGDVNIAGGNIKIENNGGYYFLGTTTTSSGSSNQSGGWGGGFPGSSSTSTKYIYREGRCISTDGKFSMVEGSLALSTTAGSKGIRAGSVEIGRQGSSDALIDINITTRCNDKRTSSSSSTGSSWGRPGGMGGGMSDGNSNKYAGSPKCIKSKGDVVIYSGNITLDAYDDAIHADKKVTIKGGSIIIDATDDGIHSDDDLTVDNGYVRVKTAYEGLEGANIYANGGTTYITTTDDCWNVTTETTGMLRVNGGFHYAMSSSGDHDGLDSNGSMEFNDGVVIVCGSSPIDAGDGNSCYQKHTGGTLLVLNNSQGNDMWSQDVKPTCANSISNTSCSVSNGSILCVANSNGKVIAALKTKTSHSKLLFAYGSSLSGYTFYKLSDESALNFAHFDGLFSEGGTVSTSSLTAVGR